MLRKIRGLIPVLIVMHASFAYAIATNLCSVEHCDLAGPVLKNEETLDSQVIVFETTPDHFMKRFTTTFVNKDNGGWYKILFDENRYSENYPILGFGGAFTDSAAILYKHLSSAMQKKLMAAYFSAEGNAYSLGRVPMASNDFSCRAHNALTLSTDPGVPSVGPCEDLLSQYTYADKPDHTLNSFALQKEDIDFKIPMIKAAISTAKNNNTDLRLFASAWSAPAWMKTNGNMVHGKLLAFYQSHWADYFVKFFKAYKEQQIKFWAVTVQNEPEENFINERFQTWQTMFYTPEEEANFVRNYLGPTLANFATEYGSKINIIIHDDQVTTIENKTSLLKDPYFAKYVAGAGLHWYATTDFYYNRLDNAFNSLNPTKKPATRFILGTEACEGYLPFNRGPSLGNWSRGEAYAHDIISDLNHHVSGWMDWNLILDMHGGPNWAKNYVDAPILVDLAKQTLYLQPMYYYLGHFSKFIRPHSRLLDSKSEGFFALEEVSFKVPAHDNLPETIVVVVLNRDQFSRTYFIRDASRADDKYLNLTIPAHSIQTIVYRSPGEALFA